MDQRKSSTPAAAKDNQQGQGNKILRNTATGLGLEFMHSATPPNTIGRQLMDVVVGRSPATRASASSGTPVSPGLGTASENTSQQRQRAYFILRGKYTGDIWHLAAAQLLQSDPKAKKMLPVDLVTVILAYDAAENQAKASYAYLRSIGLPCVVLRVTGLGQLNSNQVTQAFDADMLDKKYVSQNEGPVPSFDSLYKVSGFSKFGKKNSSDPPRTLRYDVSTSILMQFTQLIGVQETRDILSKKLWGADNPGNESVQTQATAKVEKLKTLIEQATSGSHDSAILFNYRESEDNPELNSNMDILMQVEAEAEKHNCKVITILTGVKNKQTFADRLYLDIFESTSATESPMQDRRVTACFWSGVKALHPETVKGIIGGRSGSMDLPAFIGIKSVSWDQPLYSDKCPRQDKQVVQLCRLLNQGPNSFYTFLDETTAKEKTIGQGRRYYQYSKLKAGFLNSLLDVEPEIAFEKVSTEKKQAWEDAIEILSVKGYGIKTVNLEKLYEELGLSSP